MSAAWQFGDLRMFGYDILSIDVPWPFDLYSEAGAEKSAAAHYDTMSLDDIAALRIGDLCRGDCLVLMWATEALRPKAHAVMDAWGVVYKTSLVWRKVTVNGKPRMGTGYRARTMHEPILLGVIGNPKHKPLPSLFDGVAREHSRKPESFFAMVEERTPGAARADVFGRQSRPGWDVWGREATKFDHPQAA